MATPRHLAIFMLFVLFGATCLASPACMDDLTCSGSVEDQEDDHGSLLHLKTVAKSKSSICGNADDACPTGCKGPCTADCKCANGGDVECFDSCGSGGGGKTTCPPKPCPQSELPGSCNPLNSGRFCASNGAGQECSTKTCPHGFYDVNLPYNECNPQYGVPPCPNDGTCPTFSAIRQAGSPPIMKDPIVPRSLNLVCEAACQCNVDGGFNIVVPPCTISGGDDEKALTDCYCFGMNVALDYDKLDECGFATLSLPSSSELNSIVPPILSTVSDAVADNKHATCPGSGNRCAGDQCCPGIEATDGDTFPCPSANRNYDLCAADYALCPGTFAACSGNECCPGIPETDGKMFPCPIADKSYTGCETSAP